MKLSKKIQILISAMEQGHDITLKSGNVLSIPEDHIEPGFFVTSSHYGDKIIQIGSEDAWMALINNAKEISEQEISLICANIALTDHKRSKT